jgi:hypothetical protein
MLMTAATELGPGQWIPNILTFTTGVSGVLYLVWINGLMAIGRTFAGPIAHKVSPVAMLMGSSFFSLIGLFALSRASNPAVALAAATIFAIGICFFWPTMLGVVSERFPQTGALGLAIMGGAGMLSVSFVLPQIGHRYDEATQAALPPGQTLATASKAAQTAAQAAGGAAALQVVAFLPLILFFTFGAIFLFDRARGGYRKTSLTPESTV